MHTVFEDPKIKKTLELLAEGKTREEVAVHFKNKNYKTIDMYFRRRGFKWNGETYEELEKVEKDTSLEATYTHTKAAHVLRQLALKNADMIEIARKNGFSSIEELGSYMKSQGYVWNGNKETYEYKESAKVVTSTSPVKTELKAVHSTATDTDAFLATLYQHKDRLFELLQTDQDATLPRYKFKGSKANKTLGMPASITVLLHDYSKQYNVTQRDIMEVALADFFKRYGYEEQLNRILQM